MNTGTLVGSLIMAAVLAVLIAYETTRFAELRDRLRHQLASGGDAT